MTDRTALARRTTATAGGLAGIGVASALLAQAGRTLPFPAADSPAELLRWATGVGPATVTFTAARGVGALLVAWLAATWALAVAVRVLRLPAAVRATDGLTLPFVRRLADLTAGAAVVVVSLVPAAHAGAATPDPAPLVVMRDLGPTTSPVTTTTAPRASTTSTTTSTSTTVMVVPAPPEPAETTAPAPRPTVPSPPASADARTEGRPLVGTWVIAPGDTLWHVAERTAGDHLGRPASLAEVVTQLDHLLAVNADRLVIPGDADLVFPGQEFLIP
jgi:hypothetical protein